MRGLLVVPLLLLSAGCWQPRYFIPRENLNGTGPDGNPSAVYAVDGGEGAQKQRQGEIRLWSKGAKAHFTDEDEEVVDLHIGFELENTSDAPLGLDVSVVRLEELFVDGYLQDYLEPHEVTGEVIAAPGSTARVNMVFRPATTYPAEIDSFSVRFAVRAAKGQLVGQVTPFVPGSVWRRGATVNSPLGYGRGGYYGSSGFWGGSGLWGGPFFRGSFCR
ncbi:MAG: hypothetical protein ACI89X_001038 [Planctomycetota bacterium]|jgi:hypothetical protein